MECGLLILCALIIFIAACLLPWWFIPAIVVAAILSQCLFGKKY